MRVSSIIIAVILVLNLYQLDYVKAATNVLKPTIETITVDKKQATLGDIVKISVKIKEYQDYGYLILYFTSPTGKGINISLNFNNETNSFEGSFPITNYVEPGNYTPHMLSLYGSGITTIYNSEYNQFYNGGFVVTGTEGEVFIESINVDKKDVIPGDTVKVSLKTADHQGINYMNSYFMSPITNQRLTVSLYYNPETNAFEGNIPITSITESGTYMLTMLNTYEVGGNTTAFYNSYYYDKFRSGDFAVSGTNQQNIVDSITLDKSEVTVGETIKFTLKSSEELVGISYLNIYYSSPVSSKSFSVDLYFNNESKLFEGSFLVPNDFELGVYSLFMLGMYDTSGNTTALNASNYPMFENGNFSFYKAPNAPIVNDITETSTIVSGTSELNTEVFVKVGSIIIGRGKSDMEGNFSVEIPLQPGGTEVRVVVRDEAGHYSSYTTVKVTDYTAPLAPLLNDVTDVDAVVTGTAEPNSEVFVKAGSVIIGRAKTDLSGNFSVIVPIQSAGTKVRVVVRDGAGHYSPYTIVNITDVTAPTAPSVNGVNEGDAAVTGTTEPKAEVLVKVGSTIIGRAKAELTGKYSVVVPRLSPGTKIGVVVRDVAGHYSSYTTVYVTDITAPSAPVVNGITVFDTVINGTSEPFAEIFVKNGSTIIGRGNTDQAGKFSVTIPKQLAGTKLGIVARDGAGHYSSYRYVTVAK